MPETTDREKPAGDRPDMIRLPSGDWVHPDHVRSIRVLEKTDDLPWRDSSPSSIARIRARRIPERTNSGGGARGGAQR